VSNIHDRATRNAIVAFSFDWKTRNNFLVRQIAGYESSRVSNALNGEKAIADQYGMADVSYVRFHYDRPAG
jgi:hypothetical protein